MSNTEQAADAAEKVVNKVLQYLDAVEEVVKNHGQDAAELGLAALRVEAGRWLFLGVFSGIVGGWMARKAFLIYDEYEGTAILMGVFSIFLGIISLILGLNLWNWVGVFWPELYAVHKFVL